jgi:hypothetical protein
MPLSLANPIGASDGGVPSEVKVGFVISFPTVRARIEVRERVCYCAGCFLVSPSLLPCSQLFDGSAGGLGG